MASMIRFAHRTRYVGRRRLVAGALPVLLAMMAWCGRGAVLSGLGSVLVREDPLTPVDMIIVSNADPAADALEAERLYRTGVGGVIILPLWVSEPLDDELQQLQIPHLRTTALANAVLQRSGVPSRAIDVLSTPVDGTQAEIAAVAAFARRTLPQSLLFITARSHTARARWALRRRLPTQIRVVVRSPRTDAFATDSWWHRRDQSREVAMEYLRWVNTFILQDPWGTRMHG